MEHIPREWRAVGDGATSTADEAGENVAGRGRLMVAAAGAALAAALALAGWLALSAGSGRDVSLDAASPTVFATGSAHGELVVYVAGAVRRPGVYRLAAGSRVADAVAAAGGFATTVDAAASEQQLNLAALVADGAKILVPERGALPVARDAAGPSAPTASPLVDVNTASQAALEELPAIGPVTAKKIIDARAEAPFRTVDELRDRKIVGSSTFEKIRELITVEG